VAYTGNVTSSRVLAEVGVDAVSCPTLNRHLRVWVPENVRTARDLLVRPRQVPGMIRWWRCG